MRGVLTALTGAMLLLAASAGAEAAPTALPAPVTVAPTAPPASVASARVIMLRLYTSDFANSEHFYETVFGTRLVQKMGDVAHILVFPGAQGPGIILIKDANPKHRTGSFVVQTQDLAETLARAKANGAVLDNSHFTAPIQGMPAQSSRFTDPDGNLLEVLQIGKHG